MIDLQLNIRRPIITGSALEHELTAAIKDIIYGDEQRVRGALATESRTGKTLRSFRVSVTSKDGVVTGRLRSRYFVARLLEGGTKPHQIQVKLGRRSALRGKRFLRIVRADGTVIFARAVQHPGVRARHFFSAAAQATLVEAEQELRAAFQRVLDRAPIETTTTTARP